MAETTPDSTQNPDAIWLSPACDGYAGDRTWAAPAPEDACEECHQPWVHYIREDLATPSPDSEKLREAVRVEVINSPETSDFMAGVPLEAAHQRDRWAVSHDAGKTPFDWFWLIGYLSQKAADAAVRGDAEKAKHHTISTAAALANWHAHLTGADTRMRPGIDPAALGASS
jgi:hypothetical protein